MKKTLIKVGIENLLTFLKNLQADFKIHKKNEMFKNRQNIFPK